MIKVRPRQLSWELKYIEAISYPTVSLGVTDLMVDEPDPRIVGGAGFSDGAVRVCQSLWPRLTR